MILGSHDVASCVSALGIAGMTCGAGPRRIQAESKAENRFEFPPSSIGGRITRGEGRGLFKSVSILKNGGKVY
jgi:hypothetical protein